MNMKRRTFLAVGLMLCASCHLFNKKVRPQWVDSAVTSNSESLLYEVVHLSLQKAGYPVGIGADKGRREVVTGWYQSTAPFKSKGYRQKAYVNYEPAGENRFAVRVRVQRETNESFRPLDPRYAKWEEDEDNPQEAARILQYVKSFLAGDDDFEVGPGKGSTFRQD